MSLPLIGGMLVGALAGSLFNKKQPSFQTGMNANPVQYLNTNPVASVPKPPEELKPDEDNAAAKAMDEAKEKERQAALARQKGGQDIFTSPLGVVGQANVNRKQLLGA